MSTWLSDYGMLGVKCQIINYIYTHYTGSLEQLQDKKSTNPKEKKKK